MISDVMCFFVYRVIRYRRNVVRGNLKIAFPEKPEKEIREIERRFYHHLMDVAVESLKAFSMSEETICKRFKIKKPEFIDGLFRENKPVIVVAGHFNNWEWGGIAAGSQMLHMPVGFYKPLSNIYVDQFVQKKRVQGRSKLASITKTVETFQIYKQEPAAFYMIADQSPSSAKLAIWINFCNRETATLHGPEKYARINNYPVVYVDIQKIRRGYYTFEFLMIAENPATTKHGEITQKFMSFLENKIREHPQFYLWSHRRWKLSR